MNYLWMLLALFLFFGFPNYSTSILTTGTITRNIEEENAPLIVSESVQGSYGKLPCNITPPVAEDRLALVIWYKDGHTKPIYSFDMRQIKFETGTHWADDNFDGRVHFDVTGKPAALTIKNTNKDDNGLYRCRVDFQKSPTRNSKVKLQVIIPPEKLVILDDGGNNIPTYILGPYNEGSSINITCVSTGGRPPPQVTWWHDSILLDDTTKLLSDRRVSNVLEMKKLKRSHLGMVLTCQASNNNLTRPISSAVKLDMNLRPLVVKLQGENRPLSAENSYQLSCVVVGSRPAPTITWWKGSTPMKNTHERSNPDGNMTTSILTFTPTIDDRGKYLSCRAEQSLIPESGMEDGWKLDIYHIPVVTLELGTNMNSSFREGIDVFFECNIKSNPWIYKVSWRHNGNLLENNLAEGIIVANQSLVLQNVSRARSGIYTCVGSNREGDGESNPVQLDIRFAPICRPGQRNIYSTGRQEIIKVACEVEANPSDVSFVWKFNASMAESVDIPASLVAVDRGRSVAHYTPMTEHDYGTLLCWGTNEIGDQIDPCVYSITPAGEPDSLINCTVLNQTSTSFQIECIEGFDGGLPQDFVMEVFVNGTTRHPKIYRSKTPYFESRGLVPGVGYNVFVIAQNNKGRSNATILQVYTLKDPEKQTDLSLAYAPVIEDIRPFLGILVGIVVSIFLVALIIVIIVRMRGSTGRDRNNYSHQVSRDGLHNGQSIQDIRIGRDACQTSSVDSIDKNPDIIPQDGRDEDDEWTTKGHNRAFATAALAEQNAIIGSSYDRIPYAVIDKKGQNHIQQQQQLQHQHHSHQQIMNQQQQQHLHHPHTAAPQYMTTYSTLIPVSKMAYVTQHQQQQQQQQQQQHPQLQQQLLQHQPQQQHQQHQQHQQQQHQQHQQQQHQQNKTELTYAELAAPSQRIPYCSATLGRPRQSDIKRAEPNIYSQIDLAHHPMYSTSSMYGTQTMTGVTMSHPSQLATFPPPPAIFTQNKPTINSSKISIATSSAGVGLGSGLGSLAVSAIGGAGNGHGNSGMTSPCGSGSIQIGNGIGGGILPSSSSSHPATNNVPSAGICFAETNASTSSVVLKTVPEEIAGQMSGGSGEQLKSANVNHATRF